VNKPKNDLSAKTVRDLLRYDHATGEFWWRKQRTGPGTRYDMTKTAGSIDREGYIRIKIKGRRYASHRLAWLYVHGEWPKYCVDHINGLKADNRICNLRGATRIENGQNRGHQSNNTSGYKGVSFHKQARKWQAQIGVNKKMIWLGLFGCPTTAWLAYAAAAKLHHGEFASHAHGSR
jgi:hypothetical protein